MTPQFRPEPVGNMKQPVVSELTTSNEVPSNDVVSDSLSDFENVEKSKMLRKFSISF